MVCFTINPKRAAKRRRTIPQGVPPAAPVASQPDSRSVRAQLRDPLLPGQAQAKLMKEMLHDALGHVDLNAKPPRGLMDRLTLLAARQHSNRGALEPRSDAVSHLEDLKPDLTISLYPSYFTFNSGKIQLSYDRKNRAFLKDVDELRIPPELSTGWATGQREDGCMLVLCKDYRYLKLNDGNPTSRKLLLWPNAELMSQVSQDICNALASEGKLASEEGYQDTLLKMEAQLLLGLPNSKLCLQPDFSVCRVQNYTVYNAQKLPTCSDLYDFKYRPPELSNLPDCAKVSSTLHLPGYQNLKDADKRKKIKTARNSGLIPRTMSVPVASQSVAKQVVSEEDLEKLWSSVQTIVSLAPEFKEKREHVVKMLREPSKHQVLMARQKVDSSITSTDLAKEAGEVPARRTLRFQRDIRTGNGTEKMRQISQMDTYRGSNSEFEALIRMNNGHDATVSSQRYTIGKPCEAKLFSTQYKLTYVAEGHRCVFDSADNPGALTPGNSPMKATQSAVNSQGNAGENGAQTTGKGVPGQVLQPGQNQSPQARAAAQQAQTAQLVAQQRAYAQQQQNTAALQQRSVAWPQQQPNQSPQQQQAQAKLQQQHAQQAALLAAQKGIAASPRAQSPRAPQLATTAGQAAQTPAATAAAAAQLTQQQQIAAAAAAAAAKTPATVKAEAPATATAAQLAAQQAQRAAASPKDEGAKAAQYVWQFVHEQSTLKTRVQPLLSQQHQLAQARQRIAYELQNANPQVQLLNQRQQELQQQQMRGMLEIAKHVQAYVSQNTAQLPAAAEMLKHCASVIHQMSPALQQPTTPTHMLQQQQAQAQAQAQQLKAQGGQVPGQVRAVATHAPAGYAATGQQGSTSQVALVRSPSAGTHQTLLQPGQATTVTAHPQTAPEKGAAPAAPQTVAAQQALMAQQRAAAAAQHAAAVAKQRATAAVQYHTAVAQPAPATAQHAGAVAAGAQKPTQPAAKVDGQQATPLQLAAQQAAAQHAAAQQVAQQATAHAAAQQQAAQQAAARLAAAQQAAAHHAAARQAAAQQATQPQPSVVAVVAQPGTAVPGQITQIQATAVQGSAVQATPVQTTAKQSTQQEAKK